MTENKTIEKSVQLAATPARVWKALIDPAQTKQYFFACEALSTWRVDSVLEFRTVTPGDAQVVVSGRIQEIEPRSVLRFSCHQVGDEHNPELHSVVTYRLSEADGGTLLTVTQEGLGSDKNPKHHLANWDEVLRDLKKLLKKDPG